MWTKKIPNLMLVHEGGQFDLFMPNITSFGLLL